MAIRRERAVVQTETNEARTSHPTPLPAFNMEEYARESDQGLRIAEERPTRPRGFEHSALIELGPAVEIDESLSDDEMEQICWARLEDGARVPVLARPIEVLLSEPRAAGDALVLSAIDGESDARTVVDACGLPTLVALQALCDLLDSGAVRFAR